MSESIRFPGHDRFAGSKRMARAVASRPWDPMALCGDGFYMFAQVV